MQSFPSDLKWNDILAELSLWRKRGNGKPKKKLKPLLKNDFSFGSGQAFFKSKELKLPSGEVQEQFHKLVDELGRVVLYKELDSNYTSAIPGRLPQNIFIMRKALKSSKIPYLIQTYTNEGYCLKNCTS